MNEVRDEDIPTTLPNGFVRRVLDLGRSPYQKLKMPSDIEWERRCRHERAARRSAPLN